MPVHLYTYYMSESNVNAVRTSSLNPFHTILCYPPFQDDPWKAISVGISAMNKTNRLISHICTHLEILIIVRVFTGCFLLLKKLLDN